MSSQLATIPTKEPIKPKPTKNEIIAAMVEIAREKHDAQIEAKEEELEAFRETIQKRYIKEIKAVLKTKKLEVQLSYGDIYCHISIKLPETPESLELSAKERALEREAKSSFDEKGTRAMLREQLLGVSQHANRVNMLLNDAESRKHLEEVLQGITNPTAQIAA